MSIAAENMVYIDSGSFQMGSDENYGFERDNERPKKEVSLPAFYIDQTQVSNADFLEFFKDTGYVTDAERFGSSNVFHLLLAPEEKEQYLLAGGTDWWYEVEGANWRKPEGSNSSIEDRLDHPVVHVSRNDAMAYASWAGKRLPTEAEWEYAARGGHEGWIYPWGNEFRIDGQYPANIWQGEFPAENTEGDGYLGTAPVKTYDPNDYDLYQMIGNVWEWCLNPGRVDLTYFQENTALDILKEHHHYSDESYALRGGSFLCHDSYCQRYRNAGRNANTALSSTSNTGFRCVRDDFS